MPEAFDLIKKMLTVDPAKRINIKDIMAHPWLAQDSSQAEEHVLDLKIVEGMRRFSKMDPLQRIASKIVAVTYVGCRTLFGCICFLFCFVVAV